jgi:hypothetical protein
LTKQDGAVVEVADAEVVELLFRDGGPCITDGRGCFSPVPHVSTKRPYEPLQGWCEIGAIGLTGLDIGKVIDADVA